MIAFEISPQQLIHLGLSSDVILVSLSLAFTHIETMQSFNQSFNSLIGLLVVQRRVLSLHEVADKREKSIDPSFSLNFSRENQWDNNDDILDLNSTSVIDLEKREIVPESTESKISKIQPNEYQSFSQQCANSKLSLSFL